MDLSTTYLGLRLPHPLMPGSSPLADDMDTVRGLEDAGAAAIVMRSLYEEQILGEEMATYHAHEAPSESYRTVTRGTRRSPMTSRRDGFRRSRRMS